MTRAVLFAAEVNGDGLPDCAVTMENGATSVQVRTFVASNGGLGNSQFFFIANAWDAIPVAGEIDNDGDEDLLISIVGGFHRVIRRTGPAAFVLEGVTSGAPVSRLADVDGDGDFDGIGVTTSPFGVGVNQGFSQFEFCINDGTGSSFSVERLIGLGALRLAEPADLDGDGGLDLAAGRCLLWNDGGLRGTAGGTAPAFGAFSIGDLGGDGDLDLFNWPTMGLVRSNLGNGVIVGTSIYLLPAPLGGQWANAGIPIDVDGDGDSDLLTASVAMGGPLNLGSRLLMNAGNGAYYDSGPFLATGWEPTLIPGPMALSYSTTYFGGRRWVADFDRNGDQDFALVLSFGSIEGIQVFENVSSGAFVPAGQVVGVSPKAWQDLDGDGRFDLLGVAFAGGALVTARGIAGGFGPLVTSPGVATNFNDGVCARDLDGDGRAELIRFTNAGLELLVESAPLIYNPPAVVPGTGPPNFNEARWAFVEDFDDDGDLDLLYGPELQTAGRASVVIRGTGPAFGFDFSSPIRQMEARGPFADLDGDGDLDVVNHHPRLNTTRHGASAAVRYQFGAGLVGQYGLLPVVGARGPVRVGLPVATLLRSGRPGATGVLAVGTTPAAIPLWQGTVHLVPDVLIPVTLSAAGGIGEVPWSAPAGLAGLPFFQQLGLADPAAAQGVSLSNGLLIRVGL